MREQTPTVLCDKPVLQGRDAQFGFQGYANTVARLIAWTGTETPLVIGVYGEWGSGKTTLMHSVKARLEEGRFQREPRRGLLPTLFSVAVDDFVSCRVVWFDAWRYSKEEEMWVALVGAIVKVILRDAKPFEKVQMQLRYLRRRYKWPKAFVAAVAALATGGAIGMKVEESRWAQNVAFYDEFRVFFDEVVEYCLQRKGGCRLVVFIDDLDRCLPSKVVQVLESVRLFVDRPGCVFVMGADQRVILSAIRAHYQAHGLVGVETEEYLDKIVQVRFELPPLRASDVESYVRNLPGLESSTRDHLQVIVGGVRTNPRKIKRFVTHLDLQWSLLMNVGLGDSIRRQGLTEWLVLHEVCPAFGERVRELQGEVREVQRLILALKDVAKCSSEERARLLQSNRELQSLVTSETVLKVMERGEFTFSDDELEVYVHLSALPSLRSREEELRYEVERVLDELTDQERKVMQLFFGIGGEGEMSVDYVARRMGLDKHEVVDSMAAAVRKLQHPARSRRLERFLGTAERDSAPESLLVDVVFGKGLLYLIISQLLFGSTGKREE